MKIVSLFTSLLLILFTLSGFSQEMNKSVTKKYLAAPELYVFESDINAFEISSISMEQLSYLDLVKKYFTDKEIVVTTRDAYDELEGIDEKYCLSIQDYKLTDLMESVYLDYTSLFVQNGRSTYSPYRVIAKMIIDLEEMSAGVGIKRFEYAFMNLESHLKNFDDDSRRAEESYKCPDFDKYYEGNVILIRENFLDTKVSTEEALEKIASLDFKIVSQAEWNAAIASNQEGVLYVDVIECEKSFAINVHSAETGMMITSFFPVEGYKSKVGFVPFDKGNFRKVFD